jgi:P27 family predicted phage terminase small subunit
MSHRKPTRLKLIEGNPGKRKLPGNEPQPELGAEPPKWLSVEALKHWPLVAEQLTEVGLLTTLDATALGLYCEAFARWKTANDHVVQFGTVVKSPSGYPIVSPFLAIANRAYDQLVRMLAEFGMTPAARTKVEVTKKTSNRQNTALKKYL